MSKPVPALYEMEPIGVNGAMEANGRVYHFCCGAHREQYREMFPNVCMSEGMSGEYLDGTVCDQCGLILLPQGMPASYTVTDKQQIVLLMERGEGDEGDYFHGAVASPASVEHPWSAAADIMRSVMDAKDGGTDDYGFVTEIWDYDDIHEAFQNAGWTRLENVVRLYESEV
jgi:hypothetical protein